MKVISVINLKGGVGKTTLTANIGARLAQLGYKTLIIDTDPQSNLTFSFVDEKDYEDYSFNFTKTTRNLYTRYIDHNEIIDLEELYVVPSKVNQIVSDDLHLIYSHIDLLNVVRDLATSKRKRHLNLLNLQSILRNSIKKIKHEYDFILIDCPPSFDLLNQNAIVASDYYLVPVKLDAYSKDGVDLLTTQVKHMVEDYNLQAAKERFKHHEPIHPKFIGVVANQVNIRSDELISIHKNFYEQIKAKYDVFTQMIRENTSSYIGRTDHMVPVVLDYSKNNDVCQRELINLVDELIERIHQYE